MSQLIWNIHGKYVNHDYKTMIMTVRYQLQDTLKNMFWLLLDLLGLGYSLAGPSGSPSKFTELKN